MISDYLGSNSSETSTHTTRGLVSKTYYFSWNNSRPALIMGETGDSGRGLGLWCDRETMGLRPFGNVLLGAIGGTSQIQDQQ